jgi:hypothetical protein
MAQLLLRPTLSLTPRAGINTDNSSRKLFLELGERHLAYLITDTSVQAIKSFQFYTVEEQTFDQDIDSILEIEELVGSDFSEVILVCNTKDFVLVPSVFYKDHLNESILDTIHGDKGECKSEVDDVHQWELMNIYRVQKKNIDKINARFPHLKMVHVFSPLLKHLFRSLSDDNTELIKLYFYPSNINVLVLKGDQLVLAQQFYYETSEDVIYHLLNVADRFRLDVTELLMKVSGSIDDQSAMWKELLKYFLNVELETSVALNSSEVESTDMPPHYFTPLFLVPQCV